MTLATQAVRVRRTPLPQRGVMRVASFVLLCAIAAAILLPFVWMLSASFRPESDIAAHPSTLIPSAITFRNYVDIWRVIPFGREFVNTLVYAGGVTLISLLFDSMTGYALARYEFRGRKVLFVLVLLALMLPFQVTLIPIFSLLSHLGWINTYQGLIVPRATSAFGIFFMRQFFLSLPRDLEAAARVDGASELRIWWQVMMPLAKPALLTLGLFHLIYNWNDLLWPLVLTNGASTQTLPVGLSLFNGEQTPQYGLLMAGSLLALAPMVIAFLFVQRRFVEGIATTGLK
jgi:multiple sugar transport system permease protein